ncbi:MAG: recombinase family protein [Pseudomonadota bacterium]
MGRRIAYIRVSTEEQPPDRQIDALRESGEAVQVEHGVSATAKRRPVMDALLEELATGDTLVVSSVDRAFRSTAHVTTVLDTPFDRGVRVCILALGMDTGTPTGRLLYRVMAALAEFERDTLSERTKQGLAAARRRGVKLGRPRKIDESTLRSIQAQLAANPCLPISEVAAIHNCSRHTVSRAIRHYD